MLSQTKKHTTKTDDFNARQNGQSFVEYALILLLVAVAVSAGLVLTGSSVSDVYSRIVAAIDGETEENPGHIVVNVLDESDSGIANVRVYMFNEKGHYLGHYGITDEQGNISFEDVADGRYQFRADYQAQQHWSQIISWPSEWQAVIKTGQRPFTINVIDNNGSSIQAANIYAYNENGSYAGVYGKTNENGQLIINLSDGRYQFRADYQAQQYWSEVVETPDAAETTVTIELYDFTVHVETNNGIGIANATIYAYNENDGYASVYGKTNEAGEVVFSLGTGSFKFRADYQAHQYWSEIIENPKVTETAVIIKQQDFTVHVVTNSGIGIAGVTIYGYNENGSYAGIYSKTNEAGEVVFSLGPGSFKFRVDYQARQVWSDVVDSPASTETTVKIIERPFTINVVDKNGQSLTNVHVYAFNENGSYMGIYGNTNESGSLNLNVIDGNLKFRADYGGQSYWSPVVNSPDSSTTTVTIQN